MKRYVKPSTTLVHLNADIALMDQITMASPNLLNKYGAAEGDAFDPV